MRCTSPRTVGFKSDGKTLAWSQKDFSKEFATFQLPCGKCISCRLEYARQWAVRCTNEAQMYERNCFITLTYSDQNLKSPRLQYVDWQLFMKRLRKHLFQKFIAKFGEANWALLSKSEKKEVYRPYQISYVVTGEYGDKTKRPHWHAIIFNYQPDDLVPYRQNELGDQIFISKKLDELWGHNDPKKRPNEVGSVTFRSAGYVSRYSAKKLLHGKDGAHDYEPISKKSSHQAIGKRWLEKYYSDFARTGAIILSDGTRTSVPRYYEKWLKEHQPEAWLCYVQTIKQKMIDAAQAKSQKDQEVYLKNPNLYTIAQPNPRTRDSIRAAVAASKFKLLSSKTKL